MTAAATSPEETCDLLVVGGGILGLAHAHAAARRGLRVVLVERDVRAQGASIRNFGFVTVSGQEREEVWPLARRARDVWAEAAPRAGVEIVHEGLLLLFRRPEAAAVAEAFAATEMGEGCRVLTRRELDARAPAFGSADTLGALWSPHELRVESAEAVPALGAWLERDLGVRRYYGETALEVEPPRVRTSRRSFRAARVVVCPGDDFATLFPERLDALGLRRCRLSMLRLAAPGRPWPAGVMSDLGLARYAGYARLPEAQALARRLEAEQPEHLRNGVHLIAVAGSDGTLVVGDSHHYADLPDPFAPAEAEALILEEFAAATGLAPPPVLARWTGTYATSETRPFVVDAPRPGVRLVLVTTGAGASIAFGLAERVLEDLLADGRRDGC